MSLGERGGERVYLSYLSRLAWIGKGDACTRTLHSEHGLPCFVSLDVASFGNTKALSKVRLRHVMRRHRLK